MYKSTIADRFWEVVGFHSSFPEIGNHGDKLPGWIMTKIEVKVGIMDRLRFLLCGRALIRVETRTSVQVDAISASSFELIPPGRSVHL